MIGKKITNRGLSMILSALMALSSVTIAMPAAYAAEDSSAADNTAGSVIITQDGEEVSSVTVPQDDTVTLTATPSVSGGELQWEILAEAANDEDDEVWATIYGETDEDLVVNYTMVSGLMDSSGSVYLRCTASYDDGSSAVSGRVRAKVAFIYSESSLEQKAKATADGDSADSDENVVTLSVNYLDKNGDKVYSPYTAQYQKNDATTAVTLTSPNYAGYVPVCTWDNDLSSYDGSYNAAKAAYDADNTKTATTVTVDSFTITEDVAINVYYTPIYVYYTVEYYFQNVNDDEYTKNESITVRQKALTGEIIQDSEIDAGLQKLSDGEGYTALYHVPTEVAGDGSTVISSYYDRNYYLYSFELDGGHSCEPVYARYGSEFKVNEPVRAGYTFDGWEFVSATDSDGSAEDANGDTALECDTTYTMPCQNRTYKAIWKQNNVKVTIAYWKESTACDGETFNYWGSRTITALSGTKLDIATKTSSDDYDDNKERPYTSVTQAIMTASDEDYENRVNTTEYWKRFELSTYDGEDNGGVLVQGDGSTIINVYYTRKTYTLRMVYARSVVVNDETIYQVYGGNSRFFGAGANSSGGGELHTELSPATCKDLNNDGVVDDDDYLIFNLTNTSGMARSGWYQSNGEGKWANVKSLPSLSSSYAGWTIDEENNKIEVEMNNRTWTYYYMSLTKKYGEKIDSSWGGNLFVPLELCDESIKSNGTYTKAYYASVNGEYFVRYSQDYIGNPTIKGTYQRLDDNLLFNMIGTDAQEETQVASDDFTTVSFLAIWENASVSEDWNIPCMWTYNCYLQTIDNKYTTFGANMQDTVNCETRAYFVYSTTIVSERIGDKHNGTSSNVYNTGTGTWNEFPTAIEGFTFYGVVSTKYQDGYRVVDADGNRKYDYLKSNEANHYTTGEYLGVEMQHYTVEFYFKRNEYKLKFYNYNTYLTEDQLSGQFTGNSYEDTLGEESTKVGDSTYSSGYYSIDYEELYSDYEITKAVMESKYYPEDLEAGAYEFEGWYTSPTFAESTKVTWDDMLTMPANDVTVYARWSAKDHSARIFDSYSNMVKFQNQDVVTDESLIDELNAIAHSNTYETDDGWLQYIEAAFGEADEEGADASDGLAVAYEGETRYYVREGSYYYRVNDPSVTYTNAADMPSRFHNSLFTLDGVKYVYVDEVSAGTGTRVGYVRADGLIDVRHRPHGEVIGAIDNPTDPTGNGRVFSGWKYVNSSGSQVAFAPLNSPLNSDLDLYADWSSKTNVPYVIHYAEITAVSNDTLTQALKDCVTTAGETLVNNRTAEYDGDTYVYLTDDGSWHKLIADDSTGYRFDGTTHTFTPKSMTSLYEAYRGGEGGYYYPTSSGHSIQMATTTDAVDNSYTFLYVCVDTISYTVNYVDADGNTVAESKTVSDNTASIVTEKYVSVANYLPDASYKTLTLSVDADGSSSASNVITFVYTQNDNTATYIVHYMMENLDGDESGTQFGEKYYTENVNRLSTETGEVNDEVTVSPLDFTGFTMCDAAQNVYVDSTTSNETTASLTASSGSFTFTVAANGNDIYIYYDRKTYSYNVYYLAAGTDVGDTSEITDTLSDTKTVDNIKYGTTVTANAVDLSDKGKMYQAYSLSLTVSTADNNIFFFYDSLQYTVEFVIVGDEEGATLSSTQQTLTNKTTDSFSSSTVTVKDGYKFEGWYYDEDCTKAVETVQEESNLAYVSGEKSDDNFVTITPITANIPANNTDGNATTKFYAKITSIKKYVYFDPNGGRINGTAYSGENLYKVESSWLATGLPSLATAVKDGYTFDCWYYTVGNTEYKVTDDAKFKDIAQAIDSTASADNPVTITLTAKWSEATVVFHTNYDTYGIEDSDGTRLEDSAFATYYFSTETAEKSKNYVNDDGTITYFEDIPDDHVNNDWIFAGWYYSADKAATNALSWSDTFTSTTNLYAHWIQNDTVTQDSNDDKEVLDDGGNTTTSYKAFGLAGVQIRDSETDTNYPNGKSDDNAYDIDGLRFVSSVSESLLTDLYALNNAVPNYGYVMTASSKLMSVNSTDKLVKGSNTFSDGTDSVTKAVKYYDCTSQQGITKGATLSDTNYTVQSDHFNCDTYRLYTLVVTYSGDNAETNKAKNVYARSYIDYTDANGKRRTYYNDYTGTSSSHGACCTSYNTVKNLLNNTDDPSAE